MARVSESVSSQESIAFGIGPHNSGTSSPRSTQDDDILNSLSLEEPLEEKLAPSTLHRQLNLNASKLEKQNTWTSPQLASLGELDFRKAFLILSYCGKFRKRLEDVITVDSIKRLKDLPMVIFEAELWKILGQKCIEATDRQKVDIPKHLKAEKFPHFMERPNSYCSKSVLGLIYDTVDSFQMEDEIQEVWQLPSLSGEAPIDCKKLWKRHYDQYRDEMCHAMNLDKESKDESAEEIIQKYKKILYGATEFEQIRMNTQDIYNEALAIYQITYDYAKTHGVGRCNFAWKVAGRALCTLHATKQESEKILCLKSVLGEIFSSM